MAEKRVFDWTELEFCTQEERIAKLKQRLRDLGGAPSASFEAPDTPPEILEQFWRNVVEYEERALGLSTSVTLPPLEFPEPQDLDDSELSDLLWEKIEELAERRIFLEQTDHLSDRELYSELCTVEMRELTTQAVPDGGSIHFDILGGYSNEDIDLYLRYYADDFDREHWQAEWPGDRIPPREVLPHQRDSKLPKPERPGSEEELKANPVL